VQRADEAKWDSLKHLEIIMAVEAAFGVAFTAEEMASVQGSSDLLRRARGG
jgi:acyl carrier protein